MQINTKQLAQVTVVEIQGHVDHETAPNLAQTLDQLLQANVYNLVIDLSAVDYISSAGLRALLNVYKATQGKQHGDVRLAAPSALVQETLKLVGFDQIFRIYADVVEAVDSF